MPNTDDIRKAARQRQQKFRAKNRSFTVSFLKSEAKDIEARAKRKGYSVSEYLKALAQADMNGIGYVRPQDDTLQRMILEFRAIGVNLNQVVRYVNTYREMRLEDFRALQNLLYELERKVAEHIERPPRLLDELTAYLREHPDHINRLIDWLYDHKSHTDTK